MPLDKDDNTVTIKWDELFNCMENDCQMVLDSLNAKMHGLLPGMILKLGSTVPETIAEVPKWVVSQAHDLMEKAESIREDGTKEFFFYIKKM